MILPKKLKALEKIRANIAEFKQHVYLVTGGPSPRFLYSIGLSQDVGFEVILAGGAYYGGDEACKIVNHIVDALREDSQWRGKTFEIDSLGIFSLRKADLSWSNQIILGALDYYKIPNIEALQIVMDEQHFTFDTPDLSVPWSADGNSPWRWKKEPWPYPIPENSIAVTNLDALQGFLITEAIRWEEGEWEIFSVQGPDVQEDEFRTVSMGTLLALDHSLEIATQLQVGQGVSRNSIDDEWEPIVFKSE